MVYPMNIASSKPIPESFSLNAQAIDVTKSSHTSKGKKVESPPPEKINSQLFQESHPQPPTIPLKAKLITESPEQSILAKSTPTKDIIITDSGKKFDIATVWEEIDYQLQRLIGISPEHLEKTKQYLHNLTVCEFQYFEDLVDQLVLKLNAEEGTQYPLTGDLKTDTGKDDTKTSSTIQKFFKFMVAALATEAFCPYFLPQGVAASPGNYTNSPKFTYGAVSISEPGNYLSELPNACLTEPPRYGMRLEDGDSICLPDGDDYNYYYFHKKEAKSVAVSTGHGSGDLSLSVKNGYWPGLNERPSSNKRGNTECVIIKDLVSPWTHIAVKGSKEKATLAVRFDSNKCQIPMADEAATPLRLATILPLADMCAKEQAITLTGTNTELRRNNAICLPDGNQSTYHFYAFALKPPKSIAITTSHGSGDLTLWARGGRWPILDEKPLSSKPDNNQCFIISNNDQPVTYITVQGDWKNASMAVDFDKDTCRTLLRPGFTQATDDRTDGYPYTGATLLVYKLNFPDAKLDWPALENNLTGVREYFEDQSYDNFGVSWQTVEVDILESVANFEGSDNRDKWEERCREIVTGTGVSWPNPGSDKIIMLATPNVANFSQIGDNTVINAHDNYKIGDIAYGMGNAMGLRSAHALEAGSEIIKNLPDDDSWFNCDGQTSCINDRDQYLYQSHNILSLMGSRSGPMNLMYKSFFGWLDLDKDVPLVNASGQYRIHTSDQGDKSSGPVGLRIQSGNGAHTYWLEYRTAGRWSDNTRQGVLINLEGYPARETNPRYWKTTSFLLDMTPGSQNSTTNWRGDDFTDAALITGESYTDHWGGFTITPRRVGGTENSADAWIDVDVVKTPHEETEQP